MAPKASGPVIGARSGAIRFSDRQTDEGIFAKPVVFPWWPGAHPTLVTAAHTDAHDTLPGRIVNVCSTLGELG